MVLTSPTYLDESEPPKVKRPLAAEPFTAGSKEMPIASAVIAPCSNALSSTVGTLCPSETVPEVKPEGPILTRLVSIPLALQADCGHIPKDAVDGGGETDRLVRDGDTLVLDGHASERNSVGVLFAREAPRAVRHGLYMPDTRF